MQKLFRQLFVLVLGLTVMAVNVFAADPVVIKFWTWYPDAKAFQPAIDRFQQLNPNIKIELSILESKNLQEKVPLALSTEEDIDVVGIQAGAMANACKDWLADLDITLNKYIGADWVTKYSKIDADTSRKTTDSKLKMMSMVRFGADMGYYNAEIFKKYNLKVPTTIEEFKIVADTLKAKDKNILPAVYAGKEAWVNDEMMQTVLAQGGDYYNQWLYNGAKVDSPQYIEAMNGLKKFFDLGIFTKGIMDLDYTRAMEMFTTGRAATFFQGTWEATLLSTPYRKANKINLTDVGAFALPVVKAGNKPGLRSFLDAGAGITAYTKHPKEAAQWLAFIMFGEGTDLIAKSMIGTFSKVGMKMDSTMFTTPAAMDGVNLVNKLVGNPAADRNNVSSYSDIEGSSVQKVILGSSTPEKEVKLLQAEWTSGKY